MSGKGTKKIVIMSSFSLHKCPLKLLTMFLIPLTENKFGDDEVIFQDVDVFYHKAKSFKAFFLRKVYQLNDIDKK